MGRLGALFDRMAAYRVVAEHPPTKQEQTFAAANASFWQNMVGAVQGGGGYVLTEVHHVAYLTHYVFSIARIASTVKGLHPLALTLPDHHLYPKVVLRSYGTDAWVDIGRARYLRYLAEARWFARRYGVDMSEAEMPDIAAFDSFNAFFTRALRADARPQPGVQRAARRAEKGKDPAWGAQGPREEMVEGVLPLPVHTGWTCQLYTTACARPAVRSFTDRSSSSPLVRRSPRSERVRGLEPGGWKPAPGTAQLA